MMRRMSRWGVAAIATVLLSAAGAWWLVDRDRAATPLRVAHRLDRPSNVTSFDPAKLATAAGLRWTAAVIARDWTRLGSDGSETYRSPALATPTGRVFAIVATLPAKRSTPAATLLWSGAPVLSEQDFARNRQELRAANGSLLLLRGDSLQNDRLPIQYLFLHVPAGEQVNAAIEALSVVQWSDIAKDGAVGPLR